MSMAYTYVSFLGLKNGKVNGTNVSIAASCLDRVEEMVDQGFDESVVRSMTATTYVGEIIFRRYTRERSFTTLR